LAGGDGAPDLTETLQNLGINGAAVALLGFIVSRDLAASERDKQVVKSEEALGRLQVLVRPSDSRREAFHEGGGSGVPAGTCQSV
jgi:hypothetical protein